MDIEDLKKQRRWVCFILTQKKNHLDKDPISACFGGIVKLSV